MLFAHLHRMSQSFYHGCECGRTSHTFVWVVCDNVSCNKISVLAHRTISVVFLKCIPVADVGVSPVCPCRPLLHHGDGAGVNAGEVSNTRAQSLYCVCGCT